MCQNKKRKNDVLLHAKSVNIYAICTEQKSVNVGFAFNNKMLEERARMKYAKASSIPPISLIEELQNYIQGGYIYTLSRNENKKGWGELSGCKREIEKRNKKIRMDYKHGKSLEELSKNYFLSIHSTKKIIYK